MVFKLPWGEKPMFWAFEKGIFEFFANFWVPKLKPFPGKLRESVENYLNQNLVKGSFLENGCEATLSWKVNVLSVWKVHLSVFWKLLTGEVETLFCESVVKRSKLFKWKFGHRKILRKSFWSYLGPENECSERLKKTFLSFLQIFEWGSWNHFLGKWSKAFKTI